MKLLLGLDLRAAGQGAVRFSGWLRRGSPENVTVVPMHVLDEARLLDVLSRAHFDDVQQEAECVAQLQLEREGLRSTDGALAVVATEQTVDEALATRAASMAADAIVIGRQARTTDVRVVRLGTVARTLVRRLPRPVVVVPPDFATAGPGPVILATDLGPSASGAVVFAKTFAAMVGRPLLVAHVVPSYGEVFLPAATLQQFHHQLGVDRESALDRWTAEHRIGDMPRVVAQGDVVDRLLGIAMQEKACLVVVGSRRLQVMERVFTASVGTDLSRYATCPVAIVPHNVE